MNKENYSFNFENLQGMLKVNRIVGVKIKPTEQPEPEITDFTEANEVIKRIKAKL